MRRNSWTSRRKPGFASSVRCFRSKRPTTRCSRSAPTRFGELPYSRSGLDLEAPRVARGMLRAAADARPRPIQDRDVDLARREARDVLVWARTERDLAELHHPVELIFG